MMTIDIRPLPDADFARLTEIDLSEHITQIYRLVDGQLEPADHDWHRPAGMKRFGASRSPNGGRRSSPISGWARMMASGWPGWRRSAMNSRRGWRN